MNRLLITVIPLLVLVVSCSGPRFNSDDEWFWQRASVFKTETPAALLTEGANDRAADRKNRFSDVFGLFTYYVRPGMTSSQVGSVLTNSSWLAECSVREMKALAGWVPVDLATAESVFVIQLFPDQKDWSDGVIYFTLSENLSRGEGLAFLTGKYPGNKARLREFALCYPNGKILRFTKDRVGLRLMER
jgi:hypothetical protein